MPRQSSQSIRSQFILTFRLRWYEKVWLSPFCVVHLCCYVCNKGRHLTKKSQQRTELRLYCAQAVVSMEYGVGDLIELQHRRRRLEKQLAKMKFAAIGLGLFLLFNFYNGLRVEDTSAQLYYTEDHRSFRETEYNCSNLPAKRGDCQPQVSDELTHFHVDMNETTVHGEITVFTNDCPKDESPYHLCICWSGKEIDCKQYNESIAPHDDTSERVFSVSHNYTREGIYYSYATAFFNNISNYGITRKFKIVLLVV
ncbi:uncharacterized protein [Oscarella lobularis]|uniref:uncharacterized protein isoform X2 n=1 Tax=Oscarella lobularis TaxID=121494 RepID=UPI003313E959